MTLRMDSDNERDFWSHVDSLPSPSLTYACVCPEAPALHLGDCGTNGPGWKSTRSSQPCTSMRSDNTRCKNATDEDSPFCELHLSKVAKWIAHKHPSAFLNLLGEAEEQYASAVIRVAQAGDVTLDLSTLKSRVYFIGVSDQIVKIGYSIRPENRLLQIRQGSSLMPEGYDRKQVELLGSIPGGVILESRLHRLLRPHRLHGEWFTQHRDVVAVMAYLLGGEMCVDARGVFLDELSRSWWVDEGYLTQDDASALDDEPVTR